MNKNPLMTMCVPCPRCLHVHMLSIMAELRDLLNKKSGHLEISRTIKVTDLNTEMIESKLCNVVEHKCS